ncbi:hypothetical protein R5R35_001219 [Gryllus longicercus]|uniref:Uncharacterized protein n=1 Tax=Gryllus longicercus TaxID=2509291 RepID=A0AAN9VDD7_9ORTH
MTSPEKSMELSSDDDSTRLTIDEDQRMVNQQTTTAQPASTATPSHQTSARRPHDPSPDRNPKRIMTEDGFTLVTKPCRTNPPPQTQSLPLNNRFTPLQLPDSHASTSGTVPEPETNNDPPQPRNPPPKTKIGPFRIDLNSLLNPSDLTQDLLKHSNNAMTAKCNRTQLLIQPLTMTAYKKNTRPTRTDLDY